MSGLTAQLERIQDQLQRLRLIRLAEELPALLQEASKKDLPYSDFLEEVLSREIAAKHERHTAMKTSMARFPFQKTLDSFDFKFQPSIDPKLIKELAPAGSSPTPTTSCSWVLPGSARPTWRWDWGSRPAPWVTAPPSPPPRR